MSPYTEFSQLVRECAAEMAVPVQVEEVALAEVMKVARRWEMERLIEVVVAPGIAANMMVRQNLNIPVVTVNMRTMDMLEAIYNAFQISSGSVVIVDNEYRQPRFDFDTIRKVLGRDYQVLYYHNDLEIEERLQQALKLRPGVIVAPVVPIAERASQLGLTTVMAHYGRESLKEAVKQAQNVLQANHNDRQERMKLATVLNSVNDGILLFDEHGTVVLGNPAANKLLRLKSTAATGRRRTNNAGDDALGRVYGGGEETSNELVSADGVLLVVNRKHLHEAGMKTGTVVTFQAVDRIGKMEEGIRKKLNEKGLVAKFTFTDIVGRSVAIRRVMEDARKYARSEGAVLITGESGTGKELFAHSIHNESKRRDGSFVAINCATLPETLLESELFGYEEGAFTGARKGGKRGLFELAHGGTIFLDEAAELSIHLQARLLRVLQEREIMHVGGDRLIPIDVRVIAATNRNLRDAVKQGRFRQDLFYRLNVLSLKIPPLRERAEDLPDLFNFFLNKSSAILRTMVPDLPAAVLKELRAYAWPGNVRELQNFVERYLALGESDPRSGQTLRSLMAALFAEAELADDSREIVVKLASFDDMERQILLKAKNFFPGSKSQLAQTLGVSRTTLWKKIKRAERGNGQIRRDVVNSG